MIAKTHNKSCIYKPLMLILCAIFINGCSQNTNEKSTSNKTTLIAPSTPLVMHHTVSESKVQTLSLTINNPKNYASISILANDKLVVDKLNIPKKGLQTLNTLLQFEQFGDVTLSFKTDNTHITVTDLNFAPISTLSVPDYIDASKHAGLDKVNSIKYAGPTIADIDNDGDYDFIVNNHNEQSSKLYWNNGDGTVTKHDKNLARWFMHDLHGTAAGDYDNDGDLDLVVTQGGGNGKNPSKANFYTNNNGTLVLTTGDVNIDKGGRGRGAKWSDMDLDGDLDLILINEASLKGIKPQHFFYENTGDGGFVRKRVPGIEDQHPSRALITDINNDHIDDVILYGPLSVWQGNGDFTFTNVTSQFPTIADTRSIMAITDIDIDNDGDLDLYLARGKEFEAGKGEAPFVDHNPINKTFSIKPRGYKGIDKFSFSADDTIKFHNYYYLAQGAFRGKDYPLFLGREKTATLLTSGEEMTFNAEQAKGWPTDISKNGVYFGHIGNGQWQAALVRNDDIFWGFKFSLAGVDNVVTDFEPENRNMADLLLRNDNGKFTDVSTAWNIPLGGNSLGVTRGDFNNDSHQDLFVYRWGDIATRISDLMLLNDGSGKFHRVTSHGANDVGGPGNGDMGQAFDFDLDGDLDLLNGSEGGQWYLYKNSQTTQSVSNNYVLVNVGYSPDAHIDATSAHITVKTPSHTYQKRVGSAGAVFSQSLLNTVHFGLGNDDTIEKINIRWRNGETVELKNKSANQLYSTNQLDPKSITISSTHKQIRAGTTMPLNTEILPQQSNKQLRWASSNKAILSVDQQGVVTAKGKVGEQAIITATSQANGLAATKTLTVSKWFPIPVEQMSITTVFETHFPSELLVGQSLQLAATISPNIADETSVKWQSSHPKIAQVNQHGQVQAIQQGHATITATIGSDQQITEQVTLEIKPDIKPFIKITNQAQLSSSELKVGDDITVNVNYHAGSNNKVIASDEGGIRFWLRHFKSKWIPVKDTVLIDKSVLDTQSGQSSMTFSVDGLTPSAELPEGHFYLLRASFVSSDGTMNDANIYPLNIVE